MGIAEKDAKILWGRAAGKCSMPGCHEDLTLLLEQDGPIVLGEMAHVIGSRPGAPRNTGESAGSNRYENLILLCPNHHTLVDKAPLTYPEEVLRQWKEAWEQQVSCTGLRFTSRQDLFKEIAKRLAANNHVFREWGPQSSRAKRAPINHRSARTWHSRRLTTILPNNLAISNLLNNHKDYLSSMEWKIALQFIDHSEFYAEHCIDPADATAYLGFPSEFAELVKEVEE